MTPIDIPAMLKLAKEARIKADKSPSGSTWYWSADIAELTDAVEKLAMDAAARDAESQVEEYKSQLAAALNLAGQEGDRAQKAEARVKELEEKEPTWGKRMYALDRAEKAEAQVAVLREALERISKDSECDEVRHLCRDDHDRFVCPVIVARKALATCDAEAGKLRERLKAAEAIAEETGLEPNDGAKT